jgi:hypothetical protein
MRIICNGENAAEYALALKLQNTALEKGIYADVVPPHDAFALTIWSIDDVPDDERTRGMSDDVKIKFMRYASNQLHEDMVERGHDSINTLLDLYTAEVKMKAVDTAELYVFVDEKPRHRFGVMRSIGDIQL